MKSSFRFGSALVLLLMASVPTIAQIDGKALEAIVDEEARRQGIVGLSVGVMHHGKLILEKSVGKQDIGTPSSKLSPQIPLAIGSVTKQFTCAAILLLAEDKKLSVLDRVGKYYPELNAADEISLLDLMNHVSGYPDYYPLDFVDRRMQKPTTPDALINDYCRRPLDFKPGARFSYSNTGFIVLGRIVEKVSGMTLSAFFQSRIFGPLGMSRTSLDPTSGPTVATGHSAFFLGGPEVAYREQSGWIWAAGGIYSTPADLAKWNLALMDGKLLRPESFALMTRPRKLSDGGTSNYGCGLSLERAKGTRLLVHGGAVSGFLAENFLVPVTRSSVVLLSNDDTANLGALRQKLAVALMPLETTSPADAEVNPPQNGTRPSSAPTIAGPSPEAAAYHFLANLARGVVDDSSLGDEFRHFMNPARRRAAAEKLAPLGHVVKTTSFGVGERGGMQVCTLKFEFEKGRAIVSLYRSPNGKLEQLLIYPDKAH